MLSQSIHLGTSTIENCITEMRPEVTNILALVRPVAMEVPTMSSTLKTLVSSVRQLV